MVFSFEIEEEFLFLENLTQTTFLTQEINTKIKFQGFFERDFYVNDEHSMFMKDC